jgi:hypothetical protein
MIAALQSLFQTLFSFSVLVVIFASLILHLRSLGAGASTATSAGAGVLFGVDPEFKGKLASDGSPIKGTKEYNVWLAQHGSSPVKRRANT